MNPCFVDTFFFLALLNSRDVQYYLQARDLNRLSRPMVTTEWVLLELADHLCATQNRGLFVDVRRALRVDLRYEILPPDPSVLERATDLYTARSDKNWSLTDCTSFVEMDDRGIRDALTADHHFAQAGFTLLFKP